ncbi:MAG: hypothetical protein LBV09_05125 [Deferribacteraceae bacterium]|jgi:23S rRNA-/tRNA-specific pseudouridylate synthase|nr:hypothetical protein [Deferribacteraceae bacterium]
MRLSTFLAAKHGYSRRFIKKLIFDGKVTAGGIAIKADIEADEAAQYELIIGKPSLSYNIEEYLITATDTVIFLQKPPLMHTERHTPEDPLCLDDLIPADFRLLSRLDYGVGGVIAALHNDIEINAQSKTYLAWVEGEFNREGGSLWQIDAHHRRRVKAIESYDGSKMVFRLIAVTNGRSLIEVQLESAARHQVRAVCAAMGFPIVGDYIYGSATAIGVVQLHCSEVYVNNIGAKSLYTEDFGYY